MRCLSMFPVILACVLLGMLGGCSSLRMGAGHPAVTAEKTVRSPRHLALTLRLDPVPVKLSEVRRVEATIRLENTSSRFVQLEFPTSQRFELLVRDAAGANVAQWSEDQPFEAVPGVIGINPGEHLDYRAFFSTRDLQPGKRYTVTVFIINRNDLQVDLPLVPQP